MVCRDGTVCHADSKCVDLGAGVGTVCQCKVGYAGNGKECGRDTDLDGIPDEALPCSEPKCAKVRCYASSSDVARGMRGVRTAPYDTP